MFGLYTGCVILNATAMIIFSIHDVPATLIGTILSILFCKRKNFDFCPIAGEKPYVTLFTYIFEFIAYVFLPIPLGAEQFIGSILGETIGCCECGTSVIIDILEGDFWHVEKVDLTSEKEILYEVFSKNGLDSYRERYDVFVHDPRGSCGTNFPIWWDTTNLILFTLMPGFIKLNWGDEDCFGHEFLNSDIIH